MDENKHSGFIKIFRSIVDKGYYKKSEYVHLWMHLLLKANFKEREILFNNQIVIIKPGQFITGRKRLSDETWITESKVERILKCFENEQQIEQQTNNKYRLITIKNWNRYQQSEQQIEQPVNNQWTASEQPVNTDKNDKNVMNEEERKKILAEFPKVDTSSDDEDEILKKLFDHPSPKKPKPTETFYLTKSKKRLTGKKLEQFNQFWTAYNHKIGKPAAADEWLRLDGYSDNLANRIINRAKIAADQNEQKVKANPDFTPLYPERFIKYRRWEDEILDKPKEFAQNEMSDEWQGVANAIAANNRLPHVPARKTIINIMAQKLRDKEWSEQYCWLYARQYRPEHLNGDLKTYDRENLAKVNAELAAGAVYPAIKDNRVCKFADQDEDEEE